jgi:hypothetical protein
MESQPAFTLKDLLTHVIAAVTKAVSDRSGEPQPRQYARTQAAAHAIAAFQPRDAIEAMLAGHCLMLHEMIVDSVHTTLSGEEPATHRATRSGIVAMDKAFGANLDRLERYQTRGPAVSAITARAETDIADRVRRHQSPDPASPASASSSAPSSSPGNGAAQRPDAITASPEAMAALDAADPVRFAHAMGVAEPSEAYVAAATVQMADFKRQADGNNRQALAERGNRQARRHPNP